MLFSAQCYELGYVVDVLRCGLMRLRRLDDVAVLLFILAKRFIDVRGVTNCSFVLLGS